MLRFFLWIIRCFFFTIQSRLRDVSLPSHLQKDCEEVSESVPFCIDAGETGNVARFINHSCEPNLFVQCVLSNHHDFNLARVMLIAANNIPPLEVLSVPFFASLSYVQLSKLTKMHVVDVSMSLYLYILSRGSMNALRLYLDKKFGG